MRKLLVALIGTALPLLVLLLLLEVGLRFLPVPSGMKTAPINAEAPIYRFTPNQSVTNSIGWNMAFRTQRQVNNDGFLDHQDYDPEGEGPLMAVIGDSYVEAAAVSYPDTLYGRLATAVEGRGRVYSFGASAAPLSQYLIWARYARERYAADALAIVVVGNDFDSSAASVSQVPGFHHFVMEGEPRLELVPFEPSPIRRAMRHSVVARYVFHNLKIRSAYRRVKRWVEGVPEPVYVGNTKNDTSPERMALAERVIDTFFERLPEYSGLDRDRIVFVLDGMRPHLYEASDLESVSESYFARMRLYFIAKAGLLGYQVMDLQPRFIERHKADGVLFEFPTDAHWNATGHEVAADAVKASKVFRALFGGGES